MNASALVRRVRPTDALASALLVGVFAVGVAAYDAVPDEMVVHYTPPGSVYYGVETLPKEVGLFVVPAVAAVTFGIGRALPLIVGPDETLTAVGPYYRAGLVVLLALLSSVQVALVLLNVV